MSEFKITGPGAYRTRNGCRAEVVGQAKSGMWLGYSVALCHWNPDGGCPMGYVDDLIAPWTEPKSGTVWVNVYARDEHSSYSTRADADRMACHGRIACVSVNWTEGEGL